VARLEVRLNGVKIATAGGQEIAGLALELGGGRIGPVGLLVHGISRTTSKHCVWVNESIESDAQIDLDVLPDSPTQTESPMDRPVSPVIAQRSELKFLVSTDGNHRCTASIGDHEYVAVRLAWNESIREFVFDVESLTPSEGGYRDKTKWWTGRLRVGEGANIQVISVLDGRPSR
jgi:hypothetical protein